MKRYIHLFANESEFDQERQGNYYEPWVSYTKSADKVDYNKTEEEKLLGTPFTVESLGSGNVTWSLGSKTAQYSKNGGEWTNITRSAPIPVVAGDKVSFKGTNSSYKNCALKSTAKFNVMGNIMSLISGSSFTTATVIGSSSAFTNFFSGATMLVSAEKLKLPATTLASNCYQSMFSNCTSLTQAPELPATTMANSCYNGMFYGCNVLWLHKPYAGSGASCNHDDGQLLQRYVQRMLRTDSGSSTSGNHAGEQLLQIHVL